MKWSKLSLLLTPFLITLSFAQDGLCPSDHLGPLGTFEFALSEIFSNVKNCKGVKIDLNHCPENVTDLSLTPGRQEKLQKNITDIFCTKNNHSKYWEENFQHLALMNPLLLKEIFPEIVFGEIKIDDNGNLIEKVFPANHRPGSGDAYKFPSKSKGLDSLSQLFWSDDYLNLPFKDDAFRNKLCQKIPQIDLAPDEDDLNQFNRGIETFDQKKYKKYVAKNLKVIASHIYGPSENPYELSENEDKKQKKRNDASKISYQNSGIKGSVSSRILPRDPTLLNCLYGLYTDVLPGFKEKHKNTNLTFQSQFAKENGFTTVPKSETIFDRSVKHPLFIEPVKYEKNEPDLFTQVKDKLCEGNPQLAIECLGFYGHDDVSNDLQMSWKHPFKGHINLLNTLKQNADSPMFMPGVFPGISPSPKITEQFERAYVRLSQIGEISKIDPETFRYGGYHPIGAMALASEIISQGKSGRGVGPICFDITEITAAMTSFLYKKKVLPQYIESNPRAKAFDEEKYRKLDEFPKDLKLCTDTEKTDKKNNCCPSIPEIKTHAQCEAAFYQMKMNYWAIDLTVEQHKQAASFALKQFQDWAKERCQ